MPAVNHAHPICDDLCRCPRCKPAPAPTRAERSLARVTVALIVLAILAIAAQLLRAHLAGRI